MKIYIGDALRERLAFMAAKKYKPRESFLRVMQFMSGASEPRVMALCGLHWTGKTVLMEQVLLACDDIAHSCWITCEHGDTMPAIKEVLNAHGDCRYFVIDEVTELDDFINRAGTLADRYASLGRKILMAGMDSLTFFKAAEDSLFDRVYLVHTTYIDYPEFHRLLGKELDEYIMYGGILAEGRSFCDKGDNQVYMRRAVAENIQSSLAWVEERGEFGALRSYYDSSTLPELILRVVEDYNQVFLLEVLQQFCPSDLLKRIRAKFCNIGFYTDTEAALALVKAHLAKIDFLYTAPFNEGVIFIQPGIRYWQLKNMIDTLETCLPIKADKADFHAVLEQAVKEKLLMDGIFYQLLRDKTVNRDYEVRKCGTVLGVPGHVLVLLHQVEDTAVLLMVNCESGGFSWEVSAPLLEPENCAAVEAKFHVKINGKCVLHNAIAQDSARGDVLYLYAGSFLLAPSRWLQAIREHYAAAKK